MLHSILVGSVFVAMVCAPILFAVVSGKLQSHRKSH
jgi:hypothetical protein